MAVDLDILDLPLSITECTGLIGDIVCAGVIASTSLTALGPGIVAKITAKGCVEDYMMSIEVRVCSKILRRRKLDVVSRVVSQLERDLR